MGLTKRRFLILSGSVGTSTLLAGCAGEEGDSGTEEPTKTEVGPSFELKRTNVQEDSITVDDTLTAAATVENIGDETGTAAVTFNFDVSEETKETGELEPGESEQVVVDIEPPLIDPGQYTLAIELEGEQVATTPIALFDTTDEPGIYGAVFSESDLDLSDARVRVGAVDNNRRDEGEFSIDDANQFSISGADFTDVSVDITLRSTTPGEFDGIPTILALTDNHVVSNDIEFLGPYEIPEAYRTEIQLVNEDGNPIPDFTLILRSSTGVGTRCTTNENGYVIVGDATKTGVSLPPESPSNIQVDARPEGSNRPEIFGEVYGSEEGEEFVFEVSDPSRFS
ncbi:hypothetical protein [Salinibaculum rarum]|uniref:hypothetical protein n=1 Tax=Salinibaculum rarum TaxID=3058903 RepID=UPI00265FCC3F|nr:hypothetical protein [Salinibaculum sp. KK48]